MEITENFINSNNLHDAEDIDSLIELAALVRTLINDNQQAEINCILQYTMEHSFYEAFTWCMGVLQEALENKMCALQNFEFVIGKTIPDYDVFIERLQVDFHAVDNGVETVCDNNGEIESFFNNLVYKTSYKNIFLIALENFDTKDNDYVQYKLSFTKSREKAVENKTDRQIGS